MDLLTLALIAGGFYLFTKSGSNAAPSVTPEIQSPGPSMVNPVLTPGTVVDEFTAVTPVPQVMNDIQAPVNYQVSQADVEAAIAQQTGSVESGRNAEISVNQYMAMDALLRAESLGVTQEQFDLFQSIINKRNPATGAYYTLPEIEVLTGMTEPQIIAVSQYFQSVNIASM